MTETTLFRTAPVWALEPSFCQKFIFDYEYAAQFNTPQDMIEWLDERETKMQRAIDDFDSVNIDHSSLDSMCDAIEWAIKERNHLIGQIKEMFKFEREYVRDDK